MDNRRPQTWSENTDLLPRVRVARTATSVIWFVGAVIAFAVAGVVQFIAPTLHVVDPMSVAALKADAQNLGQLIDASIRAAHMRVESIASTPVLQAAVLTDAATVYDVVKTEYKVKTDDTEVLELFQIRGSDKPVTLLKLPEKASDVPAVHGKETRLDHDPARGIAIVTAATITPYKNIDNITGELVLASTIDFAAPKHDLAAHAAEAEIDGVGAPLVLVPPQAGGGAAAEVLPIAVDPQWKTPPIALKAVPKTAPSKPKWIPPVRYGALGLGLAFLVAFALGMRRVIKQ